MYLKEVDFTTRGPQTFHQRRRDWSSGRLLQHFQQLKKDKTDWQTGRVKTKYEVIVNCQCGYVSLSKILFDLFLAINNEIIEFIQ